MEELQRTGGAVRRSRPGPHSDPFAESPAELAMVTHGPYAERVPIAGLTVAQVRSRFRDRFNLPPDGLGMVDGHEVDDQTVIMPGQILTFLHRANAKGGAAATEPRVVVDGDRVVVTSPEGQQKTAPLLDVVQALAPRWFPTCIWPDGVKLVREFARGAVVVHQTASRVHNFQWIAADSPAEYGDGTVYRRVRVALPYIIVLAAYRVDRGGRLQLSQANECFFAREPLRSVDDPLSYPALLNVSKMPGPKENRPLAWICTQYFDRSFQRIRDPGARARAALEMLLRHLFEDGFNRSSEHNEGASWFGETVAAAIDERVTSIESWVRATAADPLFATEVPWLPTGKTLQELIERMARTLNIAEPPGWSAVDLARVVGNRQPRRPV